MPVGNGHEYSADLAYTLSGGASYRLDGTYTVQAAYNEQLVLANPGTVNADWNRLAAYPGQQSSPLSASIHAAGLRWTEWITMPGGDEIGAIFANLVAASGIYMVDNKGNQIRFDLYVLAEVAHVDENGQVETGRIFSSKAEIQGSATSRDMRGTTMRIGPEASALPPPWAVRFARETVSHSGFKGTVVSEIKVRDVYSVYHI